MKAVCGVYQFQESLRTNLFYEQQQCVGLFRVFLESETRMCCKSSTFSLLINELADETIGKAIHGISLGPTEIELFILLFADGFTCLHCNWASESIERTICSCKKIRPDC